MLEQLKSELGDEVNIVFRHFPLTGIHDKATLSSEAAEAAGAQDAFWEYHDLLFERQQDWAGLSIEEATEAFVEYAAELGLDTEQFAAALADQTYQEKINVAEEAAQNAGITGTPTIFVNGYRFPLEQRIPLDKEGLEFFQGIIRVVEKQLELPTSVIADDKAYEATIATEKGEIVIELFSDTAPTNVNSFVYLAQNGWYDNVTFHRVLDGFMAQGGDPSGTGIGWPGYRCEDEVTPTRGFDKAGMVAFANSGPNTNGGQFFITYGPTPHLSENFTIIGQVVSGQDVVDSLTRRNPEERPDFTGDKINTITIVEK